MNRRPFVHHVIRYFLFACVFCHAVGPAASSAQDRLVIVSPHWEGIRYEFTRGFDAYYREDTGRGVEIEWMDVGGTSEIIRFIKSEFTGKPGGIGIDMMFGGGSDPFVELARLDLLASYRMPDALLSRLPAEAGGYPIYDAGYRWYGATMAGFGIVYNKRVAELVELPLPETWEDLADPRLFSWVGGADPRKSGSAHVPFEIILQVYGWERGWQIITALGANARGFANSGSQVPKDVTSGEVAYGMAIDFYAWAQINAVGPEMIGYTMPDNLTILNPDGISILKGAPNLSVAQSFLRYVLSEPGQRLWMQKPGTPGGPERFQLNRFTVLPHLYQRIDPAHTSVTFNPFTWKSSFVYDAVKGAARRHIVDDMIGVFVIDAHAALQRTWRRAIETGDVARLLPSLGAMPITEAESLVLGGRWRDQGFRNRTLLSWSRLADEKYASGGSGSVGARYMLFAGSGLVLAGMVLYLWRLKRRSR